MSGEGHMVGARGTTQWREGLLGGEEDPGGGEEDVVGRRHAGRGHGVGRGTQ